jgi:hypothetical protein
MIIITIEHHHLGGSTMTHNYLDSLYVEYRQSITKFYQAQANFENAAPEYIDSAIAELNAAEAKMDALLREFKRAKAELTGVAV